MQSLVTFSDLLFQQKYKKVGVQWITWIILKHVGVYTMDNTENDGKTLKQTGAFTYGMPFERLHGFFHADFTHMNSSTGRTRGKRVRVLPVYIQCRCYKSR